MLASVCFKQHKHRLRMIPANTSFSCTAFADSFFSKLETYFVEYPGTDRVERFEVEGPKRKRRVHDVENFRSRLSEELQSTMETAEEAFCLRKLESVVDDEAQKSSGSALGTLTQVVKKNSKYEEEDEADNRAGPSSVESSPASVNFSDIDYESFEELNIQDFLLKMKDLFLKSTDQFTQLHQKSIARDLLRIATDSLLINLNPLEFGIPIRARARLKP